MGRFLFTTQPIGGHVLPALPIVAALVERGNEVLWYSGRKYRTRIEATGARFAPYRDAYDFDDDDLDAAFPERGRRKGIAQLRFDLTTVFMKQIAPQHRDLAAILHDFPADAVVGDPTVFAAFTLNAAGGPPDALYNVSCLGTPGRDVTPFGLPGGTKSARRTGRSCLSPKAPSPPTHTS